MKPGFRRLATLKLVVHVVGDSKLKRTAAPSRGLLARQHGFLVFDCHTEYCYRSEQHVVKDVVTAFVIHKQELLGTDKKIARWRSCVSFVNHHLGTAVGRMYIERYFSKEARENVSISARAARFYRAMHFSAKRGIAIACRLSVCPSVGPSVRL